MPDAPELPDDPAALKALVIAARIEKTDLAEEVARLRAIVAAFQRASFGRRSETLDPDQLQLDLELALEKASQEIAETRADEDAADATRKASRTERRRVNRGALPGHLPRVEIVVEPDDRVCPCCGGALHVIGEDRAERLDVVPAQYRVLVTRRPKYACRACSDAVVQAPAPPRLIPGGLPTEALVAEVLTAKYADHAPLHRQAQAMARQGLNIDRSTLGDWVGCAARELKPVHARLVEILKASPKLFADETTAPVLDPGRGRAKAGWLWALARDDRPWGGADPPAVAFLYAEGRGAEDAARHLAGFAGILQVDGYAAYRGFADPRRTGGPATLALCWAHARRKFYEIAAAGDAPVAQEALRRIAGLYAVETDIRGRDAGTRRTERQARSRPIVDALKPWLEAQLARLLGKSRLAEAIRYALKRWDGLSLPCGPSSAFGRAAGASDRCATVFRSPRRRPRRDRQQRRRARHPPDCAEPKERALRRLGPRRRTLGRRRLAGRDLQAEQREPAGLLRRRPPAPRRRPPAEQDRRSHALGLRQSLRRARATALTF